MSSSYTFEYCSLFSYWSTLRCLVYTTEKVEIEPMVPAFLYKYEVLISCSMVSHVLSILIKYFSICLAVLFGNFNILHSNISDGVRHAAAVAVCFRVNLHAYSLRVGSPFYPSPHPRDNLAQVLGAGERREEACPGEVSVAAVGHS